MTERVLPWLIERYDTNSESLYVLNSSLNNRETSQIISDTLPNSVLVRDIQGEPFNSNTIHPSAILWKGYCDHFCLSMCVSVCLLFCKHEYRRTNHLNLIIILLCIIMNGRSSWKMGYARYFLWPQRLKRR